MYLTLDDGTAGNDARDLASEYCHELICIPHQQRQKFTAGFYAELALNLVSNLPYAISKYESAEMRRRIQELTKEKPLRRCRLRLSGAGGQRAANLSCPAVLFQHNVEAMIWKRHSEVQTNQLKHLYLYGQWRKMQAFEGVMCRRFDRVIAVSREDSELMQREYNVTAIDDVPTGVDTAFFRPRRAERRDPHNLVFTGSMDWLPNEDAIRYFTDADHAADQTETARRDFDRGRTQSLSGFARTQPARPFDNCYRTRRRCATIHGTRGGVRCAAANRRRHASENL